jgi:hypothetical protein
MGIGRPQSFTTSTRGDSRTENEGSDTSPLTPADSVKDEFYYYDDLLAAKRVQTADVTYCIPRRNWTTGTVYDMYRHDYGNRITGTTTTQTSDSGASNLYDATFYVLSSDNHVYKCLYNNGGAASTVEPTGTSNNILETSDDYKWKYMYTLSSSQQVNFLSTDFMAVTTNSTVSSGATDGGLNVITIKSVGSGGTDGTHTGVTIRGDGSGGTCTVVISSGAVTSVTVTGTPINYTYAYVTLADINSAGGGSLVGAELDCIIEPKGGHGYNAVEELGGFYVMTNTNFEGSESSNSADFTTANDFRRVCIIKDPDSGGSSATATTLRATKAIVLTSVSGTFTVDEEINQTSTGAVGKVVEWDATNSILYYIQTRFNDEGVDSNGDLTAFSGANAITGQSSSATGTPDTSQTGTVNQQSFTSGYSSSELDADSGHVIYVENRAPITRASDQTENVKLIIEF